MEEFVTLWGLPVASVLVAAVAGVLAKISSARYDRKHPAQPQARK